MKQKLTLVLNILLFILFVTVAIIAFSMIRGVRQGRDVDLFGYKLYHVLTGSMEPELSAGDIIISRKYTDGMEIKIDDTVTFVGAGNMLITHKVVGINESGTLTTQGTANPAPDAPIPLSAVKAVMVRRSGFFTFLFNFLQKPAGFALFIGIPVAVLLIQIMITLAKANLKKR
jgi:signal peptidase